MQSLTSPTAGQEIYEESLTIIDRELGSPDLPPEAVSVVKRMIHATADFEFAKTIKFHRELFNEFRQGVRQRCPIITDVEMVRIGIATELKKAGLPEASCFLNHPDVEGIADSDNLTRCAASMQIAARIHQQPILVIGNAPTALQKALDLADTGRWQPRAIVAIPVGFVGVIEAKNRLAHQSAIPYLTALGRKGGSAATAAALNALIEHSNRIT